MFHRLYQTIKPTSSRIRKVPYPYLGALSVSNDLEGLTLETLDMLMEYLNSTNNTPYGRGLGLELTTSLFFFSAHKYTCSYFSNISAHPSESVDAGRLREYLSSGWADTNHAYGDFDNVGGFCREYASACFEELDRLGVSLSVFTNHGTFDNSQNVGGDRVYHRGDVPGDGSYHVDMLLQSGTRFFWTDSLLEAPAPDRSAKAVSRELINSMRKIFFQEQRGPLVRLTLQNAEQVMGFLRLRASGRNAPNLSSLERQLQALDLDRLYSDNGVSILYQHLGIVRKFQEQAVLLSREAMENASTLFAPFKLLAQEQLEGRLWVCGLGRLLRYVEMVSKVRISEKPGNAELEVNIDEPFGESPVDYFQGLTIYVDSELPVRLVYRGEPLPFKPNAADESGRQSITVPLIPLENIW